MKKIPAQRFQDFICINKLEGFFYQKQFFFQGLGAFLTNPKPLTLMSFLWKKKNDFILFFSSLII